MKRFIILVSAVVLTGCGTVSTTTYVATTSYVPTTTYVATTRYVPTTTYVATTNYVPAVNCYSNNCCATCDRTGAAYFGYGSGAEYGYDQSGTTWY